MWPRSDQLRVHQKQPDRWSLEGSRAGHHCLPAQETPQGYHKVKMDMKPQRRGKLQVPGQAFSLGVTTNATPAPLAQHSTSGTAFK